MSEQIATLGITVDAKGAINELRVLDTELKTVAASSTRLSGSVVGTIKPFAAMDAAAVSAKGSMVGLGTGIAGVAVEAAGATPMLEALGMAIGTVTGTVLVTAAIIGFQALIEWLSHLRDASREAAEEQERLAKALGTHFLPKTGPRSTLNKEFNAALAERARLTKELGDLEGRQERGELFLSGKIKKVKDDLAAIRQAIDDAYAGSVHSLGTVNIKGDLGPMRRAEQAALAAEKEYWQSQHSLYERARKALDGLHSLAADYLRDNPVEKVARETVMKGLDLSVSMPRVSINDGLTKHQIELRDKMGILVDHGDQNAAIIKGAIENSAMIIGNAVMNAINVGGGRGGAIGGALGSGIGSAAGAIFGAGKLGGYGAAIFGPIGGLLGGLAGSLIGGLFGHHKKAVEHNTVAVQNLTAAMERNTPSGYKTSLNRFNSTYISEVRYANSRYMARGGAGVLAA